MLSLTNQTVDRTIAHNQFLLFHLGGETYGVPVHMIKEIIGVSYFTKIPLAPACLRGVMNLRGAVVPVLDLAVQFGGEPTDLRNRSCVVILELQKGEARVPVGFIVDGVNEVRSAGIEDLEPTPAFGTALRADFISGMLRRNSGFVPLLNLEGIFASAECGAVLDTGRDVQLNLPLENTPMECTRPALTL